MFQVLLGWQSIIAEVNAVMGLFTDLWKPKADVAAMAIGDNRILFCFNTEAEVQCVLRSSPWHFGKALLLLAEVKGLDMPVEVPLREQEFWVCMQGYLQLSCRCAWWKNWGQSWGDL